MTRFTTAVLFAFLCAACARGGAIRAVDAWAWPASGGPTAAYLTIVNESNSGDRLIEARSPCCATIEIHRTDTEGDRVSMIPATDGVVVPAGARVALKPGGHHLMLFEPYEPLRVGSRFEVTLLFEKAGELAVEVEVRR